MADLVIRGMEMPKSCEDCRLSYTDQYGVTICAACDDCAYSVSCPLLPLPEGHGRLIDGDALFEKMYRLSDNEGAHKDSRVDDALILRDSACYLIEDAPTIVPAEGGTEDA